ncbi:MAG: nuclear transport factor 2 family protein [Alphaproteobacteria bacterium]|nr:nuclear transport factor 2 family protein [Alphaproteobacteria bacterium]
MPHELRGLAENWVAAWNARDLDRILALYTDDFEMTSPAIREGGFDESGSLKGKPAVAAYWEAGLAKYTDLYFETEQVFVSPNSVVIKYRNERGHAVCEYLRVNEAGLIVQGAAHHA